MLVYLTLKRLASRGASSHKFTAGSQKGAMVDEKSGPDPGQPGEWRKTLHPPRRPRFEPQTGKLSSTAYSNNIKTCICGKIVWGKKHFRPVFFHDSNLSRPLINRLKYLQIRCWFCLDIRSFRKLRGVHVHPTAESNSLVCITPRSQAPQFAAHRWVKLCSVLTTMESSA